MGEWKAEAVGTHERACGRIRYEQVLRYLGHAGQEIDDQLVGRIDAGIARAEQLCEPRWLWRAFEVAAAAPGEKSDEPSAAVAHADAPAVRLVGTPLALEGFSICDFLAGATQVALLACTLGAAADRELRRLSATDPLGQVIFDAACTDLVEWGADAACREIAEWGAGPGLTAGDRFSPGYSDFPLDVQAAFLDVLQAQKRLGLTANDSSLLVPTKSVTCVVGLYPQAPERGRHLGCGACNIWMNCQLRLRGTPCWRR